jgi:hypothetical protein
MAHGRAGEVVEEEESICEPRIKATLPTQPKQSRFRIPLQSPRGVWLAASTCRAAEHGLVPSRGRCGISLYHGAMG